MSSPELPSERTPLINGTAASNDNNNDRENESTFSITQIEDVLYREEFLRDDATHPSLQAIHDAVDSCHLVPGSKRSDALVVLLCLRRIKAVNNGVHPSAQELAAADVPEYEAFARAELGKFLKPRMDAELDRMLWTSLLVEKGKESRQTVVSALFDIPLVNKTWLAIALSTHITRSFMRVWKQGLPLGAAEQPGAQDISLFSRMRRVATPRVLHLSELIFFLVYMGVFAHYILDPPHRNIFYPSPPPEWRTILLVVYSTSRIARDSWRRAFPSYLTLLSFLSALPSTPGPTDESYSFLIIAFIMHFVHLHIPLAPSPVFLNPLSRSTPLSVILLFFVEGVFAPVLSFFMPALVMTMFLLSISLSDVFLWATATLRVDPSPVNARVGFFFLFSVILLLFACLLTSVLLMSPSFEDDNAAFWDAYGSRVGLQTRRCFLNAINIYSTPFFFPAPLNLIRTFLVRIPRRILVLLRRPSLASRLEGTVQAALWSAVVLPVAFIVGATWAWGLAQSK